MCRIGYLNKPDVQMANGGTSTHFVEIEGTDFWLLHHWLPIQTTGEGSPIIHHQNKGSTVLFNGEIFDHDCESDMEWIEKRTAELHPVDFFEEVCQKDGFFSFIFYSTKAVIAFTDPLGKKQLYYKQGVGITSEIKSLIEEDEEFDEHYFQQTIKFGYVISTSTPYKKIKRLQPNKCYVFSPDLEEMTDLPVVGRDIYQAKSAFMPVADQIRTATSNRLLSRVPIALLLSGGLDSSIISYHLQELGANVQSYCIDNEEDLYYAKLIDSNVKTLKPNEGDLRDALMVMEQPLDLGSMLAQYNLLEQVDETVILTGDGADEVWGGYRRAKLYDSQLSDVFDEIPYYHNVRLDRMAAHFTKEIRSPFLNLDLIQHGLTIPHHQRTCKEVLRKSYRDLLPKEILDRPKEPLKSKAVRTEDPIEYRCKLIELFKRRNNYVKH